MDFETPEFITDALKERLNHSLFGYTIEPVEYRPTIVNWIRSHHGWEINPEWLSYIPGIVKGIGMVINVFTKEDEKVIIQPPVYHPFRMTPEQNGRKVVYNPLKRNSDGSYSMDFDNLAKVADEKCKVLILSNPHNPAGIVWSRDTLIRLAEFCYSHDIIVISDEIHSDMAIFGNKHIPFASVSQEAAQCSITFGAPSKTFNIAGIVSSYSIVPSDKLRNRFYSWLKANELDEAPIFSHIAAIAAFKHGEEWRKQMLKYIEDNILYVEQFCKEHIPAIKPIRPQASFLVWLDCNDLHLDHDSLVDLFVNKARLALNDGEMFGKEGKGFMRLNVAAPKEVLTEALQRIENAINNTIA
jgi:cystathionine beta-lyase